MLSIFRSTKLRYALVAVAAFMLGSATVGAAAVSVPAIGSVIYTQMINGQNTTPCKTTGSIGSQTTTCAAVVDSDGNLHVAAQGATSVNGTVSVSNFPSTQNVNIVGGSTAPAANHAFDLGTGFGIAPGNHITELFPLKVAYLTIETKLGYLDCVYQFQLSSGDTITFPVPSKLTFPVPLDVTAEIISNDNATGACKGSMQLIGY